jgi:hypothetical protein
MHHGQREARRHGSINGIPAGLQNLHSGVRSQMMHADHHAMLGADWLFAQIIDSAGRRLLRLSAEAAECKRECQKKSAIGKGSNAHRIGFMIAPAQAISTISLAILTSSVRVLAT